MPKLINVLAIAVDFKLFSYNLAYIVICYDTNFNTLFIINIVLYDRHYSHKYNGQ